MRAFSLQNSTKSPSFPVYGTYSYQLTLPPLSTLILEAVISYLTAGEGSLPCAVEKTRHSSGVYESQGFGLHTNPISILENRHKNQCML